MALWAGAVIPLAVVTSSASAQANVVKAGPSPTAVIHVPADQPNVQAGIDAAPSGGQVLVSPGVYHERIDFHGKAVEVASAQGSQATVLDGDHGGTVVTFASGEGRGSVLRGFTIRNGTSSGIAVWHSSPTVTGNVVSGNVSPSGGGIDVEFGSPLIAANRVTGNGQDASSGGAGGGGIFIGGAGSAEVVGNTVDHNSWTSVGGGIGILSSSPLLRDNVISDNSSPSLGGAVYIIGYSPAIFVDNLIVRNTTGKQGGGIYVSIGGSPGPMFVGNSMAGNQAAAGSAMYFDSASLAAIVVVDNVVVGPSGRGVVACNPAQGMFQVPQFSHNDVYNGSRLPYAGCGNPTGLSGNISADPRFADATTTPGDYRLTTGSPAVDAGANGAPSVPLADLAGQPRITDGNGDGMGVIDMGAYETSGPPGLPPGPQPPDPPPPATIHVPSDQPTVQAGIDRVAPGGVVIVAAGTYTENVDFHGKAVAVRSASGAASTVIDGGGTDNVVSFVSGEGRTSVLQGFTVRNGGGQALGGGIYVRQASPTIIGNVVTHNIGQIGAGIHVLGFAPLIEGNEISDNHTIPGSSGGFGGGVFLSSTAGAEVTGNTIEGNSNDSGGGLAVYGPGAVIENNVIRRNISATDGGGVLLQNAQDITFVQNIVADNEAAYRGAGISGNLVSVHGAALVNNTFAGNVSPLGSAIWAEQFDPNVVVANNIVTGPLTPILVDCARPGTPSQTQLPQFSNNDIFNGGAQPIAECGAVVGQKGNISSDARFVEASPLAPDYHLQGGSPAIDAGSNQAPAIPAADLDGRPRIVDGNADGIATIDMGAYEASAPAPPATGSSWGWNGYGQLGAPTGPTRVTPGAQVGLKAVVGESAGLVHSIVLQADGTVRAVGWNGAGQLGDGTTTDRSVPVAVQGLTGVVQVAAGVAHSLALRSDGTVWAWGWNAYGQLGDGTAANRSVPVPVIGLTGVIAVSAGTYHSLALKADGTVWAWGWNAFGQLGDGTTVQTNVPVQVAGVVAAVSIAAGGLHSVAATASGSVWAWGWNGAGQLGTGTTADSHRPVPVVGLTGVVKVSAGMYHSLALKADGTAWGWGWNAFGQLGDATIVDRHVPVSMITGTLRIRDIAAGAYHSVLLGNDGRVLAAGWNGVGQLGDGSTVDRHTATPLPGLTGVTGISAGGYHSVAY